MAKNLETYTRREFLTERGRNLATELVCETIALAAVLGLAVKGSEEKLIKIRR